MTTRTRRAVGTPDDVRAALADAGCLVPPVPTDAPPHTLAWLRAHVARFANGAEHDRRRAIVVAELARIDPEDLRRAARDRTLGRPAAAPSAPVAALAAALGVGEAALDAVVADVAVVAAAYHPGTERDVASADAGVERLVQAVGPPDSGEAAANRVGLLVQACAATAALIEGAAALAPELPGASVDAVVAETLRRNPPARTTRRLAAGGGEMLVLDLAAAGLPFGHGPRRCPGEDHARALAAGVLEAVLDPGR